MVDIKKQISYWRDNALEDLNVARDLVRDAKVRHGLFFAHLAIEKALKASVCNTTGDIAPCRPANHHRTRQRARLLAREGQWPDGFR